MKTLNLIQGSPEWLAHRRQKFNASEAPVMMAASTKMRRDELLAAKAGYGDREYSEFVQRLFDEGHETEALARPLVEEDLGEELYPVSGISDCGLYASSYDGLTLLEEVIFEHKLWNESLAEAVRKNELPPEYYWQLEHQLLTCPSATHVIFVVSDGTREKRVTMEYQRVPGRAEALIRGWKQFQADLEAYEHEVIPAKLEADPIDSFPALRVNLVGEVRSSNLPVFRSAALEFINNINTDLQSDQDFANAEEAVKFCDKTEKEIDVVKKAALAQTATIEELFRALDDIKEAMRKKRLALNKLVTERKEQIRADLVRNALNEYRQAVEEANKEFTPITLDAPRPDFTGAIKNKRTMASLKGAVNDELARVKIALNEVRDHVRESLRIIHSAGTDYQFLFSDAQQLVTRAHDYVAMLTQKRVDDHKAAEKERIEREAQAKAERMRAEEKRKEEADARARADAEAAAQQSAQQASSPTPQMAASNVTEMAPTKPRVTSSGGNTPLRPTDDQIIETLALRYRVHEFKVIEWLIDMDLELASERIAASI